MRHIIYLIACPMAMLFANAGHAQGSDTRPQGFSVHDLDGDGSLSISEYAALREHCRTRRGARGQALCNPGRLLPFVLLDSDGDGRIAEAELLDTLGARHRYRRGW